MNTFAKMDIAMRLSPKEQLLFLILLVWSLAWKGVALWKAARRGEKDWFIALLVINTIGILEILYLYVFSKKIKEEIK